jgi:hypothetical protein
MPEAILTKLPRINKFDGIPNHKGGRFNIDAGDGQVSHHWISKGSFARVRIPGVADLSIIADQHGTRIIGDETQIGVPAGFCRESINGAPAVVQPVEVGKKVVVKLDGHSVTVDNTRR